jgi:ribosomal-protein-alanine N-acetyltransferase
MIGDVTIRRAAADDLPAILSIEASSRSVTWSADGFQQELSDENALGLVAMAADGAACGHVLARRAADECTILTIAVLPSCQRQGIGRKLVEALAAQALQEHCVTLFLEVRSRNRGAQCFYKALGFLPRGVRRAYYSNDNDDAILMSRACNACNL